MQEAVNSEIRSRQSIIIAPQLQSPTLDFTTVLLPFYSGITGYPRAQSSQFFPHPILPAPNAGCRPIR